MGELISALNPLMILKRKAYRIQRTEVTESQQPEQTTPHSKMLGGNKDVRHEYPTPPLNPMPFAYRQNIGYKKAPKILRGWGCNYLLIYALQYRQLSSPKFFQNP